MTTFAAIPYRDRADLTCNLIGQLGREPKLDGLYLLDHASSDDTDARIDEALDEAAIREVVMLRFDADATLTTMWNAAWDHALHDDVDTLAFLNNDIAIPHGFIQILHQRLWEIGRLWAVCPDYTRPVSQGIRHPQVRIVSGSERHGGMTGAAFMVKVAARREGLPPIDERCRWWGGDDDLAFAIESLGYCVGKVEGVPLDHQRSQTLVTRPDLMAICHEDLDYVKQKWGR